MAAWLVLPPLLPPHRLLAIGGIVAGEQDDGGVRQGRQGQWQVEYEGDDAIPWQAHAQQQAQRVHRHPPQAGLRRVLQHEARRCCLRKEGGAGGATAIDDNGSGKQPHQQQRRRPKWRSCRCLRHAKPVRAHTPARLALALADIPTSGKRTVAERWLVRVCAPTLSSGRRYRRWRR